MAAAIGGFYGVVQLVVTPLSVFGVLVSAQALIVAMFGGVGTVWGPLIGAVTLVPLSAYLDAQLAEVLPGIQGVVYGVAIIAVVMLAPEGVFWKVRDILQRRKARADTPSGGRSPGTLPADGTAPRHSSGAIGHAGGSSGVPGAAPAAAVSRNSDAGSLAGHSRAVPEHTSNGVVLEVRNLSKAFGGLRAVSDVSLDVRRGEILGIIGPNGAGKTTLFNLMNGFIAPDSGRVLLDGESILGQRPNRICRRGVGRTFQVVKPFRRMSIADNVVIGAYVRASTGAAARALAARAISAVGLTHDAQRIAGTISNKQLRLMELARALASEPSLLLLDEIFAGLTADEVQELMDVIRRLPATGITIVIIEHTMQAMVRLVDRFVVLDHGALLADGTPDEITKNPRVIEAYLGKKWLDNA
jgi:branched-chain amino acid transport system permease protein